MSDCLGAGDPSARVEDSDFRTDPAAATDAELLRGCRAGRAESWDLLTRRYDRLVYSVATRSGLQPADAADVVQMTFIALLKTPALRDLEHVAGWLATVARRKSWQLLTAAARETSTATMPEPEAEPDSWMDTTVLHDALLRIDDPCRTLLLALYFEPDRPSYDQVAKRLERSPSGIGPLRGRCLERMRVLLSTGES